MKANGWKQVVQRAKKRSKSSMFSMRDYSIYECVLERDRIVEFLVTFYNIVIKHNHYPRRWLKVVDPMFEKENVHV